MNWFIQQLKKHFYLVLIFITGISIVLSQYAPQNVLSFLYSLGLSTKEIILFLLPLLIFGCGFRCVFQLKNESTKILLYLVALIILSNFIASWVGFGFIHVMPKELSAHSAEQLGALEPLWSFTLFKPISNRLALFGGILFAILLRAFQSQRNAQLSEKLNQFTSGLLSYVLLPLLPLFMMGFLIKMLYEGSLGVIFNQYLTLAMVLLISYGLYLTFIFLIAAYGNLKVAAKYVWHLLPAGWLGFSTLSGLAALPLSIQCSEKNIRHKPLAGGILPLSSNVHLIGESITLTILSLMVYWMHFGSLPSIAMFMQYSFMWVVSAFSIAAVPAGSIMVMIPVFSSVLGFNAEMVAYMTLIYLFIEPLSTIINILGNGFIVILIDKIYNLKRSPDTKPVRVRLGLAKD